jgi:hypothetical protein
MKPHLFGRVWSVAKDGSSAVQNEDACRLEHLPHGPAGSGLLLALADGATEAVYSGPWARALVAGADPAWPLLDPPAWNERLNVIRRQFAPLDPDAAVPWYVRNKYLAQGSQATLLAATLMPVADRSERVLRVAAIGDCSLFLLRAPGQCFTFPLVTAAEFGQSPALVANRPQPGLTPRCCQAQVEADDLILACSDALGRWLLQAMETNETGPVFDLLAGLLEEARAGAAVVPIELHHLRFDSWKQWLRALRAWWRQSGSAAGSCTTLADTSVAFHQLIARARLSESRPRLRNDDTTLSVCSSVQASGVLGVDEVIDLVASMRREFARGPVSVRPLHEANGCDWTRNWLATWFRAMLQSVHADLASAGSNPGGYTGM